MYSNLLVTPYHLDQILNQSTSIQDSATPINIGNPNNNEKYNQEQTNITKFSLDNMFSINGINDYDLQEKEFVRLRN